MNLSLPPATQYAPESRAVFRARTEGGKMELERVGGADGGAFGIWEKREEENINPVSLGEFMSGWRD